MGKQIAQSPGCVSQARAIGSPKRFSQHGLEVAGAGLLRALVEGGEAERIPKCRPHARRLPAMVEPGIDRETRVEGFVQLGVDFSQGRDIRPADGAESQKAKEQV